MFENIPSYGSGVYPKVDDKSILPNVNPINQPETFKVKLLEYQKLYFENLLIKKSRNLRGQNFPQQKL